MKLLKRLLKLTPFLAGTAYVCKRLEQKQKQKFSIRRILAWVSLGVLLALLCSSYWVWQHHDDQFTGQTDNCAVVFGAAVWRDDQPSHALSDRTEAAITLYRSGKVGCLVFSGGASKYGAHEVAVMSKIALARGVRPEAIVEDLYGDNTLATLLNLKMGSGYVFVSNDFHLARIGAMAKRLGFEDFSLHAAPYQRGRYTKNTEYFMREVFGTLLVWMKL